MSTALYASIIDWNEKRGAEDLALAHEVWDMTPWVVDVFDGPSRTMRYRDMLVWCHERWGDQAWWPKGEKRGGWQRGGATIDGWTWWGFDTEEKMIAFTSAWPTPSIPTSEGEGT